MMNEWEFDKHMNRLRDEFGEKAFGKERMVLIWKYVHKLTEPQFAKIVEHFFATAKHAPLPHAFREAARAELYGGKKWQDDSGPDYVIQCAKCQDVGFLFIRAYSETLTWCYCDCGCGSEMLAKQNLALPIWDKSMAEVCEIRPFPSDHFKPKTAVDPNNVMKSAEPKFSAWRAGLKKAEQFWRSKLNEL